MNKKQLSKLRRLPATNSMVALAKMPGRKERRYSCGLTNTDTGTWQDASI